MVASLSEPGTLVDLSHELYKVHNDPKPAEHVGWQYKQYNIDECVQGLQYLDDASIGSYIWCNNCLADKVIRMFLDDVGTSMEEEGPTLRFWQVFYMSIIIQQLLCGLTIQILITL